MKEMRIVLAGTGHEGRDRYIRRFASIGSALQIRREPDNVHDCNAIAVYLECRVVWGLIRAWKMIGYVPATRAARLSPRLDSSAIQISRAYICNMHAPDWRNVPAVTALIEYDVRQQHSVR